MRHALATLLAATSLATLLPSISAAQSINERQARLEARIDQGVRNRSLTEGEAVQLRREFADIARLESRYRASGGRLTNTERSELDHRFELLSSRVRYDRNDNDDRSPRGGSSDMNINQRQRDLDAKIDAGVRGGGLTAREASDLRAEFQSIARDETQYRASGRGLSQAERAGLEQRLDRLDRQLARNRADDDRRWTNLDQRQAAFDQRLDQAIRERRVSAREAQSLRVEFRSIARLERQYRRSRPGITPAERADLNRRFDRMEANFRASMTPSDNLFDLLLGLAR
jgi:hypothetical protein